MFHNLRDSIHQIEVRETHVRKEIRSSCGVGLVEGIIAGEIVHNIRAVDLRYIMHRTHKMLGMLVKVFLVFMQHWVIDKKTIRDISLIWTITFVIKLFLFVLTLDLIIDMLVLTWWISLA